MECKSSGAEEGWVSFPDCHVCLQPLECIKVQACSVLQVVRSMIKLLWLVLAVLVYLVNLCYIPCCGLCFFASSLLHPSLSTRNLSSALRSPFVPRPSLPSLCLGGLVYLLPLQVQNSLHALGHSLLTYCPGSAVCLSPLQVCYSLRDFTPSLLHVWHLFSTLKLFCSHCFLPVYTFFFISSIGTVFVPYCLLQHKALAVMQYD